MLQVYDKPTDTPISNDTGTLTSNDTRKRTSKKYDLILKTLTAHPYLLDLTSRDCAKAISKQLNISVSHTLVTQVKQNM